MMEKLASYWSTWTTFGTLHVLKNNHTFDVHITEKKGWTELNLSSKKGRRELVAYFPAMATDI